MDVERSLRRIERSRPPVLALDLRRVTFVDSTALRMIVSADARARRDRRRLVVIDGSASVQRLFSVTLLRWRLDIVDDPSQIEGFEDARD